MDIAIKNTLGDISQEQALELSRRLWRAPVWDLKIVAGRILARKSVAPDAGVWGFVTGRLADLDGWAVADNLAPAASRCLTADPGRLDGVETWIESPHLWTRRAALVFTLPWAKEKRDPERMLGWAARLADDPRMVHPEGDRLVAARIVEARSRTGSAVSDGARRKADRRRQARGDEVFEVVKPVSVGGASHRQGPRPLRRSRRPAFMRRG